MSPRYLFACLTLLIVAGCSGTVPLLRHGWNSQVADYVLDFSFTPADSSRGYALVSRSGPRLLVTSTDGFVSASDVSSFNEGDALEVHPSQPGWMYVAGKAILRSRDFGKTWFAASGNLDPGYGIIDLLVPPQRPGRIYALTQQPVRIYEADSDSLVWRLRSEIKGSHTYGVALAAARGQEGQSILYLAYYLWEDQTGHVLSSEDEGLTWQEVGRGLPKIEGFAVSQSRPDEPYAVANGSLYRFAPTENAWRLISAIPASISIGGRLGINPRTDAVFISTFGRFGSAHRGNAILRSTDGGRTWEGG